MHRACIPPSHSCTAGCELRLQLCCKMLIAEDQHSGCMTGATIAEWRVGERQRQLGSLTVTGNESYFTHDSALCTMTAYTSFWQTCSSPVPRSATRTNTSPPHTALKRFPPKQICIVRTYMNTQAPTPAHKLCSAQTLLALVLHALRRPHSFRLYTSCASYMQQRSCTMPHHHHLHSTHRHSLRGAHKVHDIYAKAFVYCCTSACSEQRKPLQSAASIDCVLVVSFAAVPPSAAKWVC